MVNGGTDTNSLPPPDFTFEIRVEKDPKNMYTAVQVIFDI